MTDSNGYTASQNVIWESNVPQIIADIYFNYVRVLPSWKRNFPAYIPSRIVDVEVLGHHKMNLVTDSGEYVFAFEERNTLVLPAAESVVTGTLTLFYNNHVSIQLSVSPPDVPDGEKVWVARGVEEFIDGAWVNDLLQLHSELIHCEKQQKNIEKLQHEREQKSAADLKEKFSKLPYERSSLFRRLWRRFGT